MHIRTCQSWQCIYLNVHPFFNAAYDEQNAETSTDLTAVTHTGF